MKRKPRQAASVRVWRQMVALSLCVCLIAVGGASAAKKEALSVSATETKQLRKLLREKRIDALLQDGTHLRGRVKQVQDGLLTVHIKKSTGPSAMRRGQLQNIPLDRISTVQFTRYKGYVGVLRGMAFCLGGLVLAVGFAAGLEDSNAGGPVGGVAWGGMTALGVWWGVKKDKRNVTLTIQPQAHQAGGGGDPDGLHRFERAGSDGGGRTSGQGERGGC